MQHLGVKDDIDVFRCEHCWLIYRTPTFAFAYAPLYATAENYHVFERIRVSNGEFKSSLDRLQHDLHVAQCRLDALREHIPTPRPDVEWVTVDYGAGAGAMVTTLLAAGFDAHGVEPGDWIVREAVAHTQQLAGRMHTGSSVTAFPRTADLITAYDVIEHLLDPAVELERMVHKLSLGGHLLIEQPDAQSEEARVQGLAWKHVKPREHIWLFTAAHFDDILLSRLKLRAVARWYPLPGKMSLLYRKVMPAGPAR